MLDRQQNTGKNVMAEKNIAGQIMVHVCLTIVFDHIPGSTLTYSTRLLIKMFDRRKLVYQKFSKILNCLLNTFLLLEKCQALNFQIRMVDFWVKYPGIP
jgi:hypothetical protein